MNMKKEKRVLQHHSPRNSQSIGCVQGNAIGERGPICLADQHKSLKTKYPYFTEVRTRTLQGGMWGSGTGQENRQEEFRNKHTSVMYKRTAEKNNYIAHSSNSLSKKGGNYSIKWNLQGRIALCKTWD